MPAVQECGQSVDAHLHRPADLGQELGKRCGISPGLYGHPAQEVGTGSGFSAIYSDAHWSRVPDAKGGVTADAFQFQ